jgi:hypothetical protein
MNQGPSETATLSEIRQLLHTLVAKVDSLSLRLDNLERGQSAESQPAPSVAGSRSSQYDALANQIPELPGWALDLASSLRDTKLTKRERAFRAWESGTWAKFCLEGRVPTPRPSKPIDLANQGYVVLRAPGVECPLFCETASTYRAVVRQFEGTISHGFPSKAEARIYCGAAGFVFPERPYQWISQQ